MLNGVITRNTSPVIASAKGLAVKSSVKSTLPAFLQPHCPERICGKVIRAKPPKMG